MTPMQQLKSNLKTLSENLSENFVEINLNKAKSKVKYVQKADDEYCLCFPDEDNIDTFDKKEIKSDFIKLFKTKTKTENYSIALHFYFLNREESDYVMNVSLQTKNKKNDNVTFIISKDFSIEEFKEKLNEINKTLVINKSLETIVNNIKKNFLDNFKADLKNEFVKRPMP
jgi:hypothetical protein